MAQSDCYDVVLIGSGPGGYVAALRGAQLGLKIAVVERDTVGGVCLNWGCIPSKALLKNAEILSYVRRGKEFGLSFDGFRADYAVAVKRSREVVRRLTTGVAGLLKKARVDVIQGTGSLASATAVQVNGGERLLEGRHVMIATGARSRHLPGVAVDGRVVVTSREALEIDSVPERCVIIGGGAIGVEFAYIYREYGADVTIVEALPRLLPNEDEDISRQLEKDFSRQGISVHTGASVEGVSVAKGLAAVRVTANGAPLELEAERVIVAIGVQGNSEGIGLETVGIQVEHGFIPVNEVMQTNVAGVYAIGDVTGRVPLAHVAFKQGEIAMEHIAGQSPRPIDYPFMPRATYCHPQVASFGYTEAQARERFGEYVHAATFPLRGIGKAIAIGDYEGFAKIVVDRRYGEILGAHLIGPDVTELLPELSLARELEASVQAVGESVHAHPTLSEVLKEASLAVLGRAIHI